LIFRQLRGLYNIKVSCKFQDVILPC